MFKTISLLFILKICCIFAGTRDIPESVRKEYAEKFHEAFVTQCNGQSTRAFWIFKDAYQRALEAGEDAVKVQLMNSLFTWYREHGSPMHLFLIEPTGKEVIQPTRLPRMHIDLFGYQSEYGRTPEQAAKIREFMYGVGSTISGIFFITVGGGILTPIGGVGVGLASHGFYLMFTSLNSAYADYERSKLDLKIIESQMKNACAKDR